MKRHIMIIGAQGSGKSTVANWLNDRERPLKKTQDAIYGPYTIDIPAGYLENSWMYRYIFSLAQTARVILFLAEGYGQECFYSPNFAQAFTGCKVGLLMGCDTAAAEKTAAAMLESAGVPGPYYRFDPADEGLQQLKLQWLRRLGEEAEA